MNYISTTCKFSKSRLYRYSLRRSWALGTTNQVLFIGLNPSTADSTSDDPTIRRCAKFAKDWGFNSLEVVNIFAFRATKPKDLFEEPHPVGIYNDSWIKKATQRSSLTVACWGSAGIYRNRSEIIMDLVDNLFCININRDNTPSHPLYLNSKLTPRPYTFGMSQELSS